MSFIALALYVEAPFTYLGCSDPLRSANVLFVIAAQLLEQKNDPLLLRFLRDWLISITLPQVPQFTISFGREAAHFLLQ
jgi:hypothetical protein